MLLQCSFWKKDTVVQTLKNGHWHTHTQTVALMYSRNEYSTCTLMSTPDTRTTKRKLKLGCCMCLLRVVRFNSMRLHVNGSWRYCDSFVSFSRSIHPSVGLFIHFTLLIMLMYANCQAERALRVYYGCFCLVAVWYRILREMMEMPNELDMLEWKDGCWVGLVYGLGFGQETLTGDGEGFASFRGCKGRCSRQTWP